MRPSGSTTMSDSLRLSASRALASFVAAVLVLVAVLYFDMPASTTTISKDAMTMGEWALMLFGRVVISPSLETLALAALFKGASCWMSEKNSALIAATILAGLHGLARSAGPFVVLVPFLIFALPFWQHPESTTKAMASSALTHAFHNLYGFVCVLVLHLVEEGTAT